MKKLRDFFIRMLGIIGLCVANVNAVAYAANDGRMDKKLLEAILVFFQYCSYFVLAVGLGFVILSFKETDGAKKVKAMKLIGIAVGLYVLKPLALQIGLIWHTWKEKQNVCKFKTKGSWAF